MPQKGDPVIKGLLTPPSPRKAGERIKVRGIVRKGRNCGHILVRSDEKSNGYMSWLKSRTVFKGFDAC
jgi:hypothetical protein